MVKFRLAHLLILMAACAFWLALFQVASNMAILVQVGLIPAVVTILISGRLRESFRDGGWIRRGVLLSLFSLIWVSLYIFSIGPVIAAAQDSSIDAETLRRLYGPVIWLHDETILAGPLEKYGDWWGWR